MARKEPLVIANSQRMLTAADIAADMNVSKASAYRWMHKADLHALRIGGTLRVRESDYLAWKGEKSPPGGPVRVQLGGMPATSSLAAECDALPLLTETPLTFWLNGS